MKRVLVILIFICLMSFVSADCCPADNNPTNGVVSIEELINYLSQWKSGSVTISELIIGIGEWKNGCYIGGIFQCNSCADCSSKIQSAYAGDTVQLTADINNQNGNCIEFNGKDKIAFDCNNHKIDGDGDNEGYGIYLSSGSDNNTIINCEVSDFYHGIYLYYSSYNTFTNALVSNNEYGIRLSREVKYNTFTNSYIEDNSFVGLYLDEVFGDIPQYNLIYDNYFNNTCNTYINFETPEPNYFNTTLDCSSGSNIIGGSCIGGNYWTSPNPFGGYCYDGPCSFKCSDYNQDGICDSTCNVGPAATDYDYLPLTKNVNKCVQVIDNGNTDDKIDVVFVPDGYMTDEDLEYFESSILPVHISGSDGILSREPFLLNASRFNFYYLNMSNDFGCSEDGKESECWLNYRYLVPLHCPFYDEIVTLVNTVDWHGGYAWTGLGFAVAPGGPLTGIGKAEQITSHEFGHSFCGLKDEYNNIFPISQPDYPNCDVYGCPKWCTGTPTQPEPPWNVCDTIVDEGICSSNPDCIWVYDFQNKIYRCILYPYERGYFGDGLSCDPGVECWHNCHGTNGFRSSSTSIMRSVIDDIFNKVSKEHINYIFRCCYPESLAEFTSTDCNAWNIKNSYRYSSCTTYGG